MEIIDKSIEPVVFILEGTNEIPWEQGLIYNKSRGFNAPDELVCVQAELCSGNVVSCGVGDKVPVVLVVDSVLFRLQAGPAPVKDKSAATTDPEISEVEVTGNFERSDGHSVIM